MTIILIVVVAAGLRRTGAERADQKTAATTRSSRGGRADVVVTDYVLEGGREASRARARARDDPA